LTPNQEATQYEQFAATTKGNAKTKLEAYIAQRSAPSGKRGRPVTPEAVRARLAKAGYDV
jgi:hypothetical protein